MATVLALPLLYEAVVARFAAEVVAPAVPVPQRFGWREPPRKDYTGVGGSKIIWYPGDPDGLLGEIGAARYPGPRPDLTRSLGTLNEQFTVEIIGFDPDPTKRENELAQYTATRLLFDAWWRAVYLYARDTVSVTASEWMVDKKERRYGAGIRALCTIQAMIPDAPYTDGNAATLDDLTVVQTTTELDVSEVDNFTAEVP